MRLPEWQQPWVRGEGLAAVSTPSFVLAPCHVAPRYIWPFSRKSFANSSRSRDAVRPVRDTHKDASAVSGFLAGPQIGYLRGREGRGKGGQGGVRERQATGRSPPIVLAPLSLPPGASPPSAQGIGVVLLNSASTCRRRVRRSYSSARTYFRLSGRRREWRQGGGGWRQGGREPRAVAASAPPPCRLPQCRRHPTCKRLPATQHATSRSIFNLCQPEDIHWRSRLLAAGSYAHAPPGGRDLRSVVLAGCTGSLFLHFLVCFC